MKLLLDQGLPRSAAAILSKTGIDTLHVGQIGMSSADDESILRQGEELGRVIVTLDADFHTILAMTNAVAPSVIRIRIEGLRGDGLAALLGNVLAQCGEDLARGAAITVRRGRIGVRWLPIGDASGPSE